MAQDPDVGGGVDREKLKDSDFVLADERKFPVVTPDDVSDAVSSWGRYKGPTSFESFKRRLMALCRRKGEKFMAELPEGWKKEETKSVKVLTADEEYVTIGGYGIVFGGKDLDGFTFTPETDLWLKQIPLPRPILFQHGLDPTVGLEVLGQAVKAEPDDVGVWVEAQLAKNQKYMGMIAPLLAHNALGFSTGSAPHVVRDDGSKTYKSWPVLEISLTPTPAEPRTMGVSVIKALSEMFPAVKALIPEAEAEAEAGSATEEPTVTETIHATVKSEGENTMTEQTQAPPAGLTTEQIIEASATAALKSVERWMTTLSAEQRDALKTRDAVRTDSFGDFLKAVAQRDAAALLKMGSTYMKGDVAVKDMTSQSGAAGGYLVPAPMLTEIMSIATEQSFVRGRAYKQPMTSRTLTVPRLNQTGSTAHRSHNAAGVVSKWLEEGGTLQETQPTLSQFELVAHELGGYTQVTQILAEDGGVPLESLLRRLFALTVAYDEDYAFLRENGVGKPLGVLNSAAVVKVARETAATVKWEDFVRMFSRLLPTSVGNAVWVANMTTAPHILLMKDGSGRYLFGPDVQTPRPLGIPLVWVDKMPTVGNEGDLALLDLSYYIIGDRRALTIASSEHYAFLNQLMTYRFTYRIDGQPWIDAPFYADDGVTTLSPFVVLDDTES